MITQWIMSYSVAVTLCLAPLLVLVFGLLVLTAGLHLYLPCRGCCWAWVCGHVRPSQRTSLGRPCRQVVIILLKMNEMIYLWIILESFLTHIQISQPLVHSVTVLFVHHGIVGVSWTARLGAETPPERLGPICDGLFSSILRAVCIEKHEMRWFMILSFLIQLCLLEATRVNIREIHIPPLLYLSLMRLVRYSFVAALYGLTWVPARLVICSTGTTFQYFPLSSFVRDVSTHGHFFRRGGEKIVLCVHDSKMALEKVMFLAAIAWVKRGEGGVEENFFNI